jgi:hypothetical protein
LVTANEWNFHLSLIGLAMSLLFHTRIFLFLLDAVIFVPSDEYVIIGAFLNSLLISLFRFRSP